MFNGNSIFWERIEGITEATFKKMMLRIFQNWRRVIPQIKSCRWYRTLRVKRNTWTHHSETADCEGEEENDFLPHWNSEKERGGRLSPGVVTSLDQGPSPRKDLLSSSSTVSLVHSYTPYARSTGESKSTGFFLHIPVQQALLKIQRATVALSGICNEHGIQNFFLLLK